MFLIQTRSISSLLSCKQFVFKCQEQKAGILNAMGWEWIWNRFCRCHPILAENIVISNLISLLVASSASWKWAPDIWLESFFGISFLFILRAWSIYFWLHSYLVNISVIFTHVHMCTDTHANSIITNRDMSCLSLSQKCVEVVQQFMFKPCAYMCM